MLTLLAQQANQTGGVATWGIVEWTAIFGLLTTFLGALTTSIIAILKATRADTRATEANTNAAVATTKADAAQQSNDRIANGLHVTQQTVTNLARDMAPVGVQQRMDLIEATQRARDEQQQRPG